MSQELLQGLGSIKTNGTAVILEDGYLLFARKTQPAVAEDYIPIEDCTHTFEYDITYESDAGNYFYIGFERYAADKTTGSNASCKYIITTNNEAKAKQRVRGTVDFNYEISSGKKTAFIRLRVLNRWNNSSNADATAKIYHLSLREITETTNKISISKNGQLKSDAFWEDYQTASFNKLNEVEGNTLYEY